MPRRLLSVDLPILLIAGLAGSLLSSGLPARSPSLPESIALAECLAPPTARLGSVASRAVPMQRCISRVWDLFTS